MANRPRALRSCCSFGVQLLDRWFLGFLFPWCLRVFSFCCCCGFKSRSVRPEKAPVFVGFRFFTRKIHAPYHKTDFPIPKREQHHSIFSLYLGGDRTFLYQGANLSYTTQGTFLYHRPNIPETALFNTKNGSILERALCYTKNNTTPAIGDLATGIVMTAKMMPRSIKW